ncbi:MAG: hypothetical protein HY062_00025 [Bacteroidetes bacterium]|nr:hypothetical protein [Bacteroidota bacterium]
MTTKHIVILSTMCFIVSFAFAHRKDIVVIENRSEPVAQKEAILILPGFGSKIHGVKDIKAYFSHQGYDLFIPHYIGRDSLQQCVINVNQFIEKHQLMHYKKLHVFSYIAGSWVLNSWLSQHPVNNIASIVYDRSPMQERAPYVLVKDNPLVIRLLAGTIMKKFSETPYPAINNDGKNIGIIIENKATKLIRKHQKTALSLGPVSFNKDSLHQACDDYLYECIDHDEMYYRFDTIGVEILYFFKNGVFSTHVRHQPYTYDFWDKRIGDCRPLKE